MPETSCPCGSGAELKLCCEPFLKGTQHAPTPEALMRSRYTAHVQANIPYIRETLAQEARKDFDENAVRKWATESEWIGLNILKAEDRKVEFVAKYRPTKDPKTEVIEHHEVALFRKDARQGHWYFVDGDSHTDKDGKCLASREPIVRSAKVGRNDPCPCESGQKFKKCCGK